MPLSVTSDTKQKLEHLPQRLSDEFADVEPGEIEREVVEVADTLLREAHFPDFVPLLAHRVIREHLLDEGHEPQRS